MALTLETQSRIQQIRSKVRDDSVTQAELREAIQLMREDRTQAHAASTTSKARKTAVKPSGDDLLSELDGM